jgi:hypothetical protein
LPIQHVPVTSNGEVMTARTTSTMRSAPNKEHRGLNQGGLAVGGTMAGSVRPGQMTWAPIPSVASSGARTRINQRPRA